MFPHAYIALDLARDRAREADLHRLAALAIGDRPSRVSRSRRLAARLLASVSRGSAAAVRRLDDRVADDLGRALAHTE